jgi:hypothetical protein
MNQILEDMLRACVLQFKGSWVQYLPLIEFAYSNSYQVTIGMPSLKYLMDESVSHPCIGTTSVRDRHWG